MTQQTINLGASANDGTGDTLRDAGTKINANFTELYTGKAPLASPTFTGSVTVPDQAGTDNSGKAANTKFVKTAIAGLTAPNAAGIYADTSSGLAGTSEGGYFMVVSGTNPTALPLYKKVSGVATAQNVSILTAAGGDAAVARSAAEVAKSTPRWQRNLIDLSTLIADVTIDTSGGTFASSGTSTTPKIPITAGETYGWARFEPDSTYPTHSRTDTSFAYSLFNASGTFISYNSAPAGYEFTAPAGAAFVQFSMLTVRAPEIMFSPHGKPYQWVPYDVHWRAPTLWPVVFPEATFAFIGDSLSRNLDCWWQYLQQMGFDNVLQEGLFYTPLPTAIAGSAVARRPNLAGTDAHGNLWSANAFVQRFTALRADATVIGLGPKLRNDWSSPDSVTKAVGTMASRDDLSIYGALHLLYRGIVNRYPNADLIFSLSLLPAQDGFTYSGGYPTGYVLNALGLSMADMAEIDEEVANFYGVPFLNLHKNSDLKPYNATNFAANYGDAVHPNAAGQALVGKQVRSWLASLRGYRDVTL